MACGFTPRPTAVDIVVVDRYQVSSDRLGAPLLVDDGQPIKNEGVYLAPT